MGYEITVRHGSVNGVRKLGHKGEDAKLCGSQYYCCCEKVECKKQHCTPPPQHKCNCNPCKCNDKHDHHGKHHGKHHEHKPHKSVCTTVNCEPCRNPCKPCDKPYRVGCTDGECCFDNLCVKAPECLLKDRVHKKLFCILKECILHLDIDKNLGALIRAIQCGDDAKEDLYNELLVKSELTATKVDEDCGRLVITLADGTVVLDTFLGDDNSVDKIGSSDLGENHHSRVAIVVAQTTEDGVGYERKHSNTTNKNEKYVAIRLGEHLNSFGTARLSLIEDCTVEGCEEEGCGDN